MWEALYLAAGTGSPVTELHFERQMISTAAESARVTGAGWRSSYVFWSPGSPSGHMKVGGGGWVVGVWAGPSEGSALPSIAIERCFPREGTFSGPLVS